MKQLAVIAGCLGLANLASAQLPLEDFDGGTWPPAGWSVIDNTGNGSWDTSSAFNHGNLAGTGECAAIDSDNYGKVDIDGELLTPPFDIPVVDLELRYDFHFEDYLGHPDRGDVDISVDGGPWINLVSYDQDMDLWGQEAVDLTAYAGSTNCRIRFHYYNANWDWYWHVDNVEVDVPGPPSVPIWEEDFDGGTWPPVGWTVIDHIGSGGWNTNSAYSRPNTTGGTGECAAVDSARLGLVDVDTELITHAFDIPDGLVALEFMHDFRWESAAQPEIGDVDISVNGGAWINLVRFEHGDNNAEQEIDLTPYAGATNVQIRFHYYQAFYEMWWQVDDVGLYLDEPGMPHCFGNSASGNPCPCGNDNDGTTPLGGCRHDDSVAGARLDATGVPSVTGDTVVFRGSRGPISNSTLFFQANNDLDGTGVFLGDGIRCAGGGLIRLKVKMTDANGDADSSPMTVTARSASFGHVIQPGETLHYQWWIRDSNGSVCGNESNTSNSYAITWKP